MAVPMQAKAGPLTEFCAKYNFTKYYDELSNKLGVFEPGELVDVADQQFIAMGMNTLELRRVRRRWDHPP